jgi:hypothetical protein
MRVPKTAGLLIENIRKKALTGIFRGLRQGVYFARL